MRDKKTKISELMQTCGVGFGTSGARGLVSAMTDEVCYTYTLGFLQHIADKNKHGTSADSKAGALLVSKIAVAGDLRPSTPRIMSAVFKAIKDFGAEPINCGFIPSPAVALFGIANHMPSIMVTGSHIPDDRNGIKFNLASGEILKEDETGIREQSVIVPNGLFDSQGAFLDVFSEPELTRSAYTDYLDRYLTLFPSDALFGKRIGVYQHSGVARQMLVEILQGLGADVIKLGYSEQFVPVDTEAIRPEDVELGVKWSREFNLDAIVSTDGDADRPLVSDEQGRWLRGDVAGVLSAKYLGIQCVVTPVSSNSIVEKSGWFTAVKRTKIGSPYVIEAMDAFLREGRESVAGYEANGGLLLGSDISINGKTLTALPTRDAVIVILSILLMSVEKKSEISTLVSELPQRYTYSDRLKNFPTETSKKLVEQLSLQDMDGQYPAIIKIFGRHFGTVKSVDRTDGLRIVFGSDQVVHLRPSGNAPELRCYTESSAEADAVTSNQKALASLQDWLH